jgi:glutamate/tyrosine decarboxylase-like PLP-dependent enzyme
MEKACRVAGVQFRALQANKRLQMDPQVLQGIELYFPRKKIFFETLVVAAIEADIGAGLVPIFVLATCGNTDTCSFDPVSRTNTNFSDFYSLFIDNTNGKCLSKTK